MSVHVHVCVLHYIHLCHHGGVTGHTHFSVHVFPDFQNDKAVLGELFSTLSRLAVRNEFCQEIMDLGGLILLLDTLESNMDHQVLHCGNIKVVETVKLIQRSLS